MPGLRLFLNATAVGILLFLVWDVLSAASNEVALATLLVVGFGLHNATEGFGIVAPLAADVDHKGARRRPSWPFLLSLALIGGGPTFVGTWIGHGFTNEAVSVVFLTL